MLCFHCFCLGFCCLFSWVMWNGGNVTLKNLSLAQERLEGMRGPRGSYALPASPFLPCPSKHSRTASAWAATGTLCRKSPRNLGHVPCNAGQLAEAEATGHTSSRMKILDPGACPGPFWTAPAEFGDTSCCPHHDSLNPFTSVTDPHSRVISVWLVVLATFFILPLGIF